MGELIARRLIVTADELGLHPTINTAVTALLRGGVVKSCSLMPTGAYFWDAVERLGKAGVRAAGVQLSVTSEYERLPLVPCTRPEQIASLIAPGSTEFGRDPRQLRGFAALKDVEAELSSQIERVLSAGLVLTHLCGSMNFYDDDAGGAMFRHVVSSLAIRHGIPARGISETCAVPVRSPTMIWDGFDTEAVRAAFYSSFLTRAQDWDELVIRPGGELRALAEFTRAGMRRFADFSYFSAQGLADKLARAGVTVVGWADVGGSAAGAPAYGADVPLWQMR